MEENLRYWKCWKCGCITVNENQPEYVCVNSAPHRTSGICGGEFTEDVTEAERTELDKF